MITYTKFAAKLQKICEYAKFSNFNFQISIIFCTFAAKMNKPILVFDLGGVLMNHNTPAYLAAMEQLLGRELMRQLGIGSPGNPSDFSLLAQYERGEVESADFIGKICAMAHQRIRPLAVVHAWNLLHGGIPSSRLDYLRLLRAQGYRLYLLSNNNDLRWKHTCSEYPELPHLFDRCFLSHEMHCTKPGKEIYLRADAEIRMNTALEHAPSQGSFSSGLSTFNSQSSIIFVDDIEENRQSATQFVGWQTCASMDDLQHLLQPSSPI